MRVATCILALSLLVPLVSLSAQMLPEPGARVRVTAPDQGLDRQSGTWQGFSEGAFDFEPDGQTSITRKIQLASVTSLEVSRGRKSRWLVGLGLGFVAGAGAGAVLGYTTDAEGNDLPPAGAAAIFAVPGAVLGAVIGTLIGASSKADRWEEVPLDQLRVSLAPQRDGRFGIGLSLAF